MGLAILPQPTITLFSKQPMKTQSLLRLFGSLFLLLLAGTGVTQAHGSPWRPLGPWGGPVFDLRADPHNPDHLYALIGDGRILESDYRGESWHPFARLPTNIYLAAWAISPHDPSILLADDNEGHVFLSHDGGKTWHRAYLNYDTSHSTTPQFYFHPHDPDVVYLIDFPDLFVSCNGGWNWFYLRYGVNVMLFHPEDGDILYLGTSGGVLQSWDGGRTWRVIGLPGKDVVTLVMAPDDPDTIYADVRWGPLYRSTDGGRVWLEVPTPNRDISRSRTLAVTSNYVVIEMGNELWISDDRGETWRMIAEPLESMGTLYHGLFTPNDVFYVGAERGLFRSDDGGESWAPKNDGITSAALRAFAIDSATGETMLAGVAWHTLFKSEDGGASWQVIYEDEARSDFTALAIDPHHPQTYYAAKSTSGVIKSEDGGATWRAITEGLTASRVNVLILDPSQPESLLVGTDTGVFRSEDGGEHWERVGLENANVRILVLSQGHPQVVYAGLDHAHIYRSDDGGTSWTQMDTPPGDEVFDLAVDPNHPHVLFAATAQSGLVKSEDGGETWERLSLEKPLIQSVALHPRYPRRVFVMDGEGKAFASLNGGDAWVEMGQLPVSWVIDMVVVPAGEEASYAQTLFVVAPSAGVYRYDHAWSLHLPRLIRSR